MQDRRTHTPSSWPVLWVDWPSKISHDPAVDLVWLGSDIASRNNPPSFRDPPPWPPRQDPLICPELRFTLRTIPDLSQAPHYIFSFWDDWPRKTSRDRTIELPHLSWPLRADLDTSWPTVTTGDIARWMTSSSWYSRTTVLDYTPSELAMHDSHLDGQPCGRFWVPLAPPDSATQQAPSTWLVFRGGLAALQCFGISEVVGEVNGHVG